jgi:hypothetical protein
MALTIVPYTQQFDPAVRAFNERLHRAEVRFQFPESTVCADGDDEPIVNRGFVAVLDGETVHGGYLIKEQDFWLNGRQERLGYLRLPLSEGVIDRRYSTVGIQLIAHAVKRQPLLFGLGIGGREEAFARVVSALGWTLSAVPFLFHVARPFRVARGLTAVRRTVLARCVAELAGWSGGAWAVARSVQARPTMSKPDGYRLTMVDDLDDIADQMWQQYRERYRLVGRRDASSLARLYSQDDRPYLRFVLHSPRGVAGWVVALDTTMTGDKHFGDLRVATIVDCFGDPADAVRLMAMALRALIARGVDLIVSNQSSDIWADAMRRVGFLTQSSNFFFAASPALARTLGGVDRLGTFHLTRGDGDGPVHL